MRPRRGPSGLPLKGCCALLLLAGAGPATAPASPAAAAYAAGFDIEHLRWAKAVPARRSQDPIGAIAERMQLAATGLGDGQTDGRVQDPQRSATADLDGIIKQLEAQAKGGGSGASPNPTKPLNKSVITGGPGGSGPLHDARAGTRVWGQLPAHDREQITQSQTEGFPAGYESVLASYYGRLAQEQVAGDAADPAQGPTTRPADDR